MTDMETRVRSDFSVNNQPREDSDGDCIARRSSERSHGPTSGIVSNPTEIDRRPIDEDDAAIAASRRRRRDKMNKKKKKKEKREKDKRKRTQTDKMDKTKRLSKPPPAEDKDADAQDHGPKRVELSSQRPLQEPKARAARPRIPGPLDDGQDLLDELAARTEALVHASPAAAAPSPAPAPAPNPPPARPPRQSCPAKKPRLVPSQLDRLPVEMRLLVYEEILTVRQPIMVHSGWQQVYKRQRLRIPTGILRTCKRFYREAVGVLYGCNTFLYRLRDKIPCMTDVDQVAHMDQEGAVLPTTTNEDHDAGGGDDDNDDDSDHELDPDDANDPDWREDLATTRTTATATATARPRNARRKTRAAAVEPDIHVPKHLHLFRRLVIEAEKNRFAQGTKALMANAIQRFAFIAPSAAAATTNIKTLTIRVAPQRDPHGGLTFVDFFHARSPVMRAIETVNCQFLRLNLMTRHMHGSSAGPVCRFTIDMRHRRLVRRVRAGGLDDWAGDAAMQAERRSKAAGAEVALGSLEGQVRRFCDGVLRQEGACWDVEGGWEVIDAAGAGDGLDDAWEGGG
ncbi:hypothetical protein E4U41_000311 [Claviceps citrina]|nr:hypothetical protein E4U41_000311 [Claviceps citrina]